MNQVILTGRLGKDGELSFTPNGTAVCTLSVCTSDNKKQPDGSYKEENVQWHTVKVWGKAGERVGSLAKGSGVFVQGEVRYESWEKDGVKHYKTVIHSFRVEGLSRVDANAQQHSAPKPAPAPQPNGDIDDDPLPF